MGYINRGIILLAFWLAFGSAAITRVIVPLQDENAYDVLYSNGKVYQQNLTGMHPCSIGKGIIYIFSESEGRCFSQEDLTVKWGTVNQLDIDDQRTNNAQSPVTLVSSRLLSTVNTTLQGTYLFAALVGGPGNTQDIVITQGSQYATARYVGKLPVIPLEGRSTMTSNDPLGQFCSTITGTCAPTVNTGANSREDFYYVTGQGTNLYVVKNTSESVETVFLTISTAQITRFLPTATSVVAERPIAISYKAYLDSAIPSIQYESMFETIPEMRVKRQALPIAIAALVIAKNLEKATAEGFKTTTQNQKNIAKANLDLQEKNYELAVKIYDQEVVNQNTQRATLELRLQNQLTLSAISGIARDTEAVNDFMLARVSYDRHRSSFEEKRIQEIRTNLLSEYSDKYIVEESYSQGFYYASLSDGSPAQGKFTDTDAKCGETQCYLKGYWYKYRGYNDVVLINSPILYTADCGVYFKAESDLQAKSIGARINVTEAISFLRKNGFTYIFINPVSCGNEAQFADDTITKLDNYLEYMGYNTVKVLANNRFQIDCQKSEGNNITINGTEGTPKYSKFYSVTGDPVCEQVMEMQALKADLDRFIPNNVIIQDAYQAFVDATGGEIPFTKLIEIATDLGRDGLHTLAKALDLGDIEQQAKMNIAALVISISVAVLCIGVSLYVCYWLQRRRPMNL